MSKQKNKLAGLQKRKAISGYCFISPFILGFLLFMIKPLFESCYMSFCNVDLSAEFTDMITTDKKAGILIESVITIAKKLEIPDAA